MVSFFSPQFPTQPSPAGTTLATTTFPTEIAPFIKDILEKSKAQQVAATYDPYTKTMLAPFTEAEKSAMTAMQAQTTGLAGTDVAQAAPYYTGARTAVEGLGQQFTGDVAQQYMNPYQQAVTDQAVRKAQERYESEVVPGLAAQAIQAQPFGGSRQAIQEGMAADTQARLISDLQERGLAASYDKGRAEFGAQKARELGQAQQYAQLGQTVPQQALRDLAIQQQVGEQQRQLTQQGIDLDRAQFLEEREFPTRALQEYSAIVRGFPFQPSTYTASTQYQPQPSLASQLIGLGTTGLGAYTAFTGNAPGKMFGFAKGGGITDVIYNQMGENDQLPGRPVPMDDTPTLEDQYDAVTKAVGGGTTRESQQVIGWMRNNIPEELDRMVAEIREYNKENNPNVFQRMYQGIQGLLPRRGLLPEVSNYQGKNSQSDMKNNVDPNQNMLRYTWNPTDQPGPWSYELGHDMYPVVSDISTISADTKAVKPDKVDYSEYEVPGMLEAERKAFKEGAVIPLMQFYESLGSPEEVAKRRKQIEETKNIGLGLALMKSGARTFEEPGLSPAQAITGIGSKFAEYVEPTMQEYRASLADEQDRPTALREQMFNLAKEFHGTAKDVSEEDLARGALNLETRNIEATHNLNVFNSFAEQDLARATMDFNRAAQNMDAYQKRERNLIDTSIAEGNIAAIYAQTGQKYNKVRSDLIKTGIVTDGEMKSLLKQASNQFFGIELDTLDAEELRQLEGKGFTPKELANFTKIYTSMVNDYTKRKASLYSNMAANVNDPAKMSALVQGISPMNEAQSLFQEMHFGHRFLSPMVDKTAGEKYVKYVQEQYPNVDRLQILTNIFKDTTQIIDQEDIDTWGFPQGLKDQPLRNAVFSGQVKHTKGTKKKLKIEDLVELYQDAFRLKTGREQSR